MVIHRSYGISTLIGRLALILIATNSSWLRSGKKTLSVAFSRLIEKLRIHRVGEKRRGESEKGPLDIRLRVAIVEEEGEAKTYEHL